MNGRMAKQFRRLARALATDNRGIQIVNSGGTRQHPENSARAIYQRVKKEAQK